jgi:DNA mismatch repair protein MutS
MAELTPMKKQYFQIKQNYQDCLLFFRLGDFYEMFEEDAVTASRELDLALTTRDRGKPESEQTPMCGIPYHAADSYIARLIAKGYKVAICEQMEDPALAKGIVDRDVIRIITPGTVTDSAMLEEGRSNYLCALCLEDDAGGAAFCDVSTGEFCTTSFTGPDCAEHLLNELGRYMPREAVLSRGAKASSLLLSFLSDKLNAMLEDREESFDYTRAAGLVCRQFHAGSVSELGEDFSPVAVEAAGALLEYLEETQKFDLSHIDRLELYHRGRYMELDWTTRRNLELTESLRTGEKRGSLLWVLDRTRTPMGGRMLRSWLERPLLSPVPIQRRLHAVEELVQHNVEREELRTALRDIGDMERLVGKAVYGTANGRDLLALANSIAVLPSLITQMQSMSSTEMRQISQMDLLPDVGQRIQDSICEDPPFSVREGGILRSGYNEELDHLRDVRDNGARLVAELESRERERTGVKKLKIGYNKVFGYYIDVPNSADLKDIPADYIRKQTLVSSERYFTPELKDLENTLLTARERIADLEYRFFEEIRKDVAAQVERVKETASCIARLDVYCSLAEVAVRNHYTMPAVDNSREIIIREGRHPVVEKTQKDVLFVPNDTVLNDRDDRLAIITGPNMAGKSTYMRQTALIVLMAQIGSFVPAKSATIGVVDRIFTRIGASDDLASGQSTFMVEMNEMAEILKNATPASLLILDEIGRGTSTYDGMAIARAVLEYCADRKKLGAKTMFATHYHELSVLEGKIPGVKNYNITAKKQKDTLVFLRKIVRGAADESYGIEVAKLAGLPDTVIRKAKQFLAELEKGRLSNIPSGSAPSAPTAEQGSAQIDLRDLAAQEIYDRLRKTDVNTLTPLEALNLLYELQKKVSE